MRSSGVAVVLAIGLLMAAACSKKEEPPAQSVVPAPAVAQDTKTQGTDWYKFECRGFAEPRVLRLKGSTWFDERGALLQVTPRECFVTQVLE